MTTALRVRIEHLWLALPIAIVTWFGLLRRVGLVDFWWHLKAGEIIVNTRSIPRADLFSFTCAGMPFVLQSWLAEVIYYATYRAGGLALLVALNTAMLVAAFLPIYALCYDGTRGARTAALSVCLAVGSLLTFSNVRSQVFSFACFSVTYWILSTYRTHRRDALWLLPIVMVLWVNLHGAFVLGIALVACVLVSETVRRVVLGSGPTTMSATELRRLAAVLALFALATVVNPEGYRVYSSVMAVTMNPLSRSFVTEWQPPRFDQVGVLGFYGPFFVALVVLLYAARRPDLTELVLFLGFSVLALTSVRNSIWFVLVSTPIVARSVGTIDARSVLQPLRRFAWIDAVARRAEDRVASGERAPARHTLNAVVATVLLVVTAAFSPWVRSSLSPDGRLSLVDEATPVGALDYMQRHVLRGNVFAPETYGDYLVWRLWPAQRSFVDSRVHLFYQCPVVLDDYNAVCFDSHWEERLARYAIQYLLLRKDELECRSMMDAARVSAGWRVLYEDDSSILLEKVAEATV